MNPLKRTLPLFALTAFMALLLITFACNKDGNAISNTSASGSTVIPPDIMVTASVQGRVVDENGQPVQGASVNSGKASTTTDVNGIFTFSKISMSSRFGFVTAAKSGYFTGSRSIITDGAASNYTSIQLIPRTETGSFTATSGGNISIQAGDTAAFTANSIITASTNAAYTGTVHVFSKYLDPTDANLYKYMPGDLRGIGSDGKETMLRSFGMLLVELQDDAGNKLQIVSGQKASLTWAIPASLQSAAPATIPLWYFNDTTGRWIQQGSATRQGNSYVGTVTHFSYWNCDAASGTVNFKVYIKDQHGNPVSHAYIQFTAPTFGTRGGYTNTDGLSQGLIPKGQSLVMEVVTDCGTTLGGINVGPALADQDLGTVTITVPDDQLTVTGTVVDCSKNPVDSGYVDVLVDGLDYRAVVTKGSFILPVNRCYNTTTSITMTAYDLTAQQVGASTTVNESIGKVDVGQLSACGNTYTQFINITINGTSYTITNPPDVFSYSPTAFSGSANGNSEFIALFMNPGLTAPGQYNSQLALYWPNTNYSYASVQTNVSAFGAVNGYVSGTITGNINDSSTQTSYPVTGSFKVQRTQ